jgi:hypothetical protein
LGDQGELKNQLTLLCTRDGTPEQARNAVFTLAQLVSQELDIASEPSKDEFEPLLQTLTSASRLKITTNKKESLKLVSILSSLSAFAECAPGLLSSSKRGDRAIKFSLDSILLGRDHSGDKSDSGEESSENDEISDTHDSGSKRRRSSSIANKGHLTPTAKGSLLEDESLSLACRRICAAIDFLVSFVRSTILAKQLHRMKHKQGYDGDEISTMPRDKIALIFRTLNQILIDRGQPPSSRDRKICKSRQDRAALRQWSAVSLMRMCDSRLKLEKPLLQSYMWHSIGNVILDEERVVREAVMGELAEYLEGKGHYGLERTKLPMHTPNLRFLALVVLG